LRSGCAADWANADNDEQRGNEHTQNPSVAAEAFVGDLQVESDENDGSGSESRIPLVF